MTNRFAEAMATRTDEELIAIVTGPADDWRPEALVAAKAELDRRGIPVKRATAITERVKKKQRGARAPLDRWAKRLAFASGATFLGSVWVLVAYTRFTERGERRKAEELARWFVYGLALLGAVLFVVALIRALAR